MKNLVIALGVIIIILLGIFFFYNPAHGPTVPSPQSAMTATSTMPANMAMSEDENLMVDTTDLLGVVASPVTIIGTVTGGNWFFEGTFPIKILDANGKVIGNGPAQAQGDWMSTSSVPFTAIITFIAPATATGSIVLSRDNPSGFRANDQSLIIPVKFK